MLKNNKPDNNNSSPSHLFTFTNKKWERKIIFEICLSLLFYGMGIGPCLLWGGGAVVVLDLDSSVRASEGDSALYSLTPSISESPCNLKS